MNSNISRKMEQVRFGNTNHRLLDRKFRKHVFHNDDNLNFNQSFRGPLKHLILRCTCLIVSAQSMHRKQTNMLEIITTKHRSPWQVNQHSCLINFLTKKYTHQDKSISFRVSRNMILDHQWYVINYLFIINHRLASFVILDGMFALI